MFKKTRKKKVLTILHSNAVGQVKDVSFLRFKSDPSASWLFPHRKIALGFDTMLKPGIPLTGSILDS